jgi:hypothetical protein
VGADELPTVTHGHYFGLVLTDNQFITFHSKTIIEQICQVKDIYHIDARPVHLKLIRTGVFLYNWNNIGKSWGSQSRDALQVRRTNDESSHNQRFPNGTAAIRPCR